MLRQSHQQWPRMSRRPPAEALTPVGKPSDAIVIVQLIGILAKGKGIFVRNPAGES